MSPTERRVLLAIGAAALVLRVGVALLTESHPLFPAYYYTDARLVDAAAASSYAAEHGGPPFTYTGNLSQHLHVGLQTALYREIGPRPFAMKLIVCALGALTVVALALLLRPVFGATPSLAAAALAAAWPSGVFYTSQNFKDGPTNLLAYAALACGLALLSSPDAAGTDAAALAAGATASLLATGLLRSYVLVVLCGALVAGSFWAARARGATRSLALAAAVPLLATAAYLPVSRFILAHAFAATASPSDPRLPPQLLPVTFDNADPTVAYYPTSPQGLSRFREIRQQSDRAWARDNAGREIGTQIFPDARFGSWLDVMAFLPKSAFYVLFMPLPGLYPMDGKLGRMAAALENLALLSLACFGVVGAVRGPKTPARVVLLLMFLAMTAGSALLEFDLGSAGRHKLLYLPLLFPFAAEEILRLLGRKEPV